MAANKKTGRRERNCLASQQCDELRDKKRGKFHQNVRPSIIDQCFLNMKKRLIAKDLVVALHIHKIEMCLTCLLTSLLVCKMTLNFLQLISLTASAAENSLQEKLKSLPKSLLPFYRAGPGSWVEMKRLLHFIRTEVSIL